MPFKHPCSRSKQVIEVASREEALETKRLT